MTKSEERERKNQIVNLLGKVESKPTLSFDNLNETIISRHQGSFRRSSNSVSIYLSALNSLRYRLRWLVVRISLLVCKYQTKMMIFFLFVI